MNVYRIIILIGLFMNLKTKKKNELKKILSEYLKKTKRRIRKQKVIWKHKYMKTKRTTQEIKNELSRWAERSTIKENTANKIVVSKHDKIFTDSFYYSFLKFQLWVFGFSHCGSYRTERAIHCMGKCWIDRERGEVFKSNEFIR